MPGRWTEFTRQIADDLAGRLTASGLYAKEARAMVNTWTSSYFQTDGTRVLFVLPQSWTDAFIPMTVVPQPKQVVRVMVGRLELLTPEREQQAESAVRSLADPDPAARQRAFAFLREQGRYVEPIVRRVLRTSTDDRVRVMCRRLLLTDFVTELRDASRNAADGKRLNVDPRLIRAQHARLLREVGLAAEAKVEAVAVLKELTELSLGDPGEIRAVALEASGEDLAASDAYETLITQWSDAFRGEFNPGTMSGLRDWWIGRALWPDADQGGPGRADGCRGGNAIDDGVEREGPCRGSALPLEAGVPARGRRDARAGRGGVVCHRRQRPADGRGLADSHGPPVIPSGGSDKL